MMASIGNQYGTKIVLPGNSAGSPLYNKIFSSAPLRGERMPQGGPFLTAAQITLIKNWIDEGAKEKVTAAVARISPGIPGIFSLSQNYPNPFNPTTQITFSIADSRMVTLTVFDILGHEVAALVNGRMDAGTYTAQWNAAGIASGMYLYRLRAADLSNGHRSEFTEVKRLVVQK